MSYYLNSSVSITADPFCPAHKGHEKIEAGLMHEERREVRPFWGAKLAGRKGKNLRAVTSMMSQASKEQKTREVLRVDFRGNYYSLELDKRIA